MNSTIPADLLELKTRVETWRTNRKYLREPMPNELRSAALEMRRHYPPSLVSRVLKLDVIRLKKAGAKRPAPKVAQKHPLCFAKTRSVCVFSVFIRPLGVRIGDADLQLRRSRSPLQTPAAALLLSWGHLCLTRCGGPMIICAVTFQNPAEMIFIQRNYEIEALPPETADYSLHKWILPRTPIRQ